MREVGPGDDTEYRGLEGKPEKGKGTLWAKIWDGPQHIVFGHDHKEGLQAYLLIFAWPLAVSLTANVQGQHYNVHSNSDMRKVWEIQAYQRPLTHYQTDWLVKNEQHSRLSLDRTLRDNKDFPCGKGRCRNLMGCRLNFIRTRSLVHCSHVSFYMANR